MLPTITTTHAIPRKLPSRFTSKKSAVRCPYCQSELGRASDHKSREQLQSAHQCAAQRQAKSPAAAVPYN